MKTTRGLIVSLLLLPAGLSPHPAAAAPITITKAQNEGFRACRALGRTGYSAVIKGTQSGSTPQRGGSWPFTIRYCFATKPECDRFVARIRNNVFGIEKIRTATCRPR